MIIRHFSYARRNGGAFIACDRLDRALVKQGVDSAIITSELIKNDIPEPTLKINNIVHELKSNIWQSLIGERTYVSNTHFSLGVDGSASFTKERLGRPDILHLHWVTHLLNTDSLARLAKLRAPMIWTLHDANPFTAGCHYPAGCGNFRTGCQVCPQITLSNSGWTAFACRAKQTALKSFPKVVVTAPSRWLLSMARQSAIFEGRDLRLMKNCISDVFHDRSRTEARARHDIQPDDITILFAAVDLTEIRKGVPLAFDALRLVVLALQQAGRQRLIGRLRPIALGRGADRLRHELAEMGLPLKNFSYVDSEDHIAEIYSLSDFVLLPSLEDNFPNIITEAAACGASVLGLPCAGPGEIIPELAAGAVAKDVSSEAFAALIEEAVTNVARFRERAAATASRVETAYSPAVVAKEFMALYEECRAGAAPGTGVETMPVETAEASVLAVASHFFNWDYEHREEKANSPEETSEGALPTLDVIGRTLVSPSAVAPESLRHTASAATQAVAKIVNSSLMIPGSRLRALVVNSSADTVTGRLTLASLQGDEIVLKPDAEAWLDLSIAAPEALENAAVLRVSLRRPLNYGLVREPITIKAVILIGDDDQDRRSPIRAPGASPASRSDQPVRRRIQSNFYAAEKFRNVWAAWLGPELATEVSLEPEQQRPALVILSVLEKAFPGPLRDVKLATGENHVWSATDAWEHGKTTLLVYEVAANAESPLRDFSIVSPSVIRENDAPASRSLGIMVADVAVLPSRSPGGVAVLRPGASLDSLVWRDDERIACRLYLSDDGFIYFEAEGALIASGHFGWAIVTDMLSADFIETESQCWLGRAVNPFPISFSTEIADERLRISGVHDFDAPCCFRGLSFKLRPSARLPSRELLARHRFFLNVTMTSTAA